MGTEGCRETSSLDLGTDERKKGRVHALDTEESK